MTGVSECSQQRGNLKDNGYTCVMSRLCVTRYQLCRKTTSPEEIPD
ncbi:hypothetical protein [Photorhabdus laumondii]